MRLPRFEEGAPGAEPEEQGFWSAVLEQIGSYVRFRRFEGEGVEPLLAPEEAVYLEMNLRLMLERTQLAALRREQVIFQQSLATASDWIATYLDTDDPGIRRGLDELEALAGVQLDQPLPVPVLLLGHAVEDSRRRRVIHPQARGEIAVDLRVVLLGGDRQRQDLLFAEVVEPLSVGQDVSHAEGTHLVWNDSKIAPHRSTASPPMPLETAAVSP